MGDEFQEIKDEEKEKMGSADSLGNDADYEDANHTRDNYSWIAGAVIIIVGVMFLVSNLTGFQFNNWWALFILIPAVFNFARAWNTRKEEGHWSRSARGSLIGGLAIALVAFIFLLDLDWGKVWPLFLILGGVAALLGGWFNS
jgi:hypothetical protein